MAAFLMNDNLEPATKTLDFVRLVFHFCNFVNLTLGGIAFGVGIGYDLTPINVSGSAAMTPVQVRGNGLSELQTIYLLFEWQYICLLFELQTIYFITSLVSMEGTIPPSMLININLGKRELLVCIEEYHFRRSLS